MSRDVTPGAAPSPPAIEIRQIAYSDETLAGLDPGFLRLDNRGNPRPDWWEYDPIRRHLLRHPPDAETFYGFLSPRFGAKTGLGAAEVVGFVAEAARPAPAGVAADVVLFSPQVDMGAFFLNLFEQNDLFDPGFGALSQAVFDRIGLPVRLDGLLMDSRHVVVSNYFVARGAFWSAWLDVTERIHAFCEAGLADPAAAGLRARLLEPTVYKGGAQRKVFLIERIASTLLATQSRWRTRAFNPYRLAWSASRLNRFPHEAVLSDALKIAARETGHPQFMEAFSQVRERLRQAP